NGAITISMWFKNDTPAAGLNGAIGFQRAISWFDGTNNFQIGMAENAALNGRSMYVSTSTQIVAAAAATSGDVPTGWHHLVAVYDGSTAFKTYLDGVDRTGGTLQNNITGFNFDTTASPIYLGQRGNGTYWDGSLDEVRIYNRALSASEISGLY